MITIKIKPVEIIGQCPEGISFDDEFKICVMRLENPKENKICFLAVSHFPVVVWPLQRQDRFFSHNSCAGCTTDPERENRVVFLLAHEDKWELSRLISEYLRLSQKVGEPQTALELKEEAITLQNAGDYSAARLIMKKALYALKNE